MFPINATKPYPSEQWWVADYASALGEGILSLDILGKPVILYRLSNGQPAALHGFCPHRSAPLSLGRVVGDAVSCGYHGFTFNAMGECIDIPSQPGAPSACSIRSYPSVEQGGLIWIWTGDPSQADPAAIPDTQSMGLGAEGWIVEQTSAYTINARYSLLIDNLMDLSHISFVHTKTIPGSAAVVATPVKVIDTDTTLNAQRIIADCPSNPFFARCFPDYSGSIDQVGDSLYCGPCLIKTGGPMLASSDGRKLGVLNFIHCITPADENRVHYKVLTTRNFALDDDVINKMLSTGGDPGLEDATMIEAVERALQRLGQEATEVSCRADGGALKARRRLRDQIEKESVQPTGSMARCTAGGS